MLFNYFLEASSFSFNAASSSMSPRVDFSTVGIAAAVSAASFLAAFLAAAASFLASSSKILL